MKNSFKLSMAIAKEKFISLTACISLLLVSVCTNAQVSVEYQHISANMEISENMLFEHNLVTLNKDKHQNSLFSQFLSKEEPWPHKGTISLGLGFQVGMNMTGKDFEKIMSTEDNFLKSLDLVEQELDQYGNVVSTNPIDSYEYADDFMVINLKGEYFITDRFAIGLHVYIINFTQKLEAIDKTGEGTLLNASFVGPGFNYLIGRRNKFGFSLKSNISMVFGSVSSLPALYDLSEQAVLNDISGLPELIESNHKESGISGFQADAMFTTSWYLKYWISIDAGAGLYYYSGKQDEAIWANAPTRFTTFTPTAFLGASFHLRNKN